jgi:hypothetical protein
LDWLSGVAIDTSDNLFVTDCASHVVRKVDARGRISTVAGNGQAGFHGDGGPANAAQFDCPGYVAVDRLGNIYIYDTGNWEAGRPAGVVRKVDINGIITTIAGGGNSYPAKPSEPAIGASFMFVSGIAVDGAGGGYVAESTGVSGFVRKIDTAGTIRIIAGRVWMSVGIAYYSGDGSPAEETTFAQLRGIAIAANGDLYFSQIKDGRIVRMVGGTADYTAKADGGIEAQSISVSMTPAVGLAGQPGASFVAVQLAGGQIYFLSPCGWSALGEGVPAAYSNGALAPLSREIVSKQDLSGMAGATVYVGYGRGDSVEKSWQDMLKNMTFKPVYTVQ